VLLLVSNPSLNSRKKNACRKAKVAGRSIVRLIVLSITSNSRLVKDWFIDMKTIKEYDKQFMICVVASDRQRYIFSDKKNIIDDDVIMRPKYLNYMTRYSTEVSCEHPLVHYRPVRYSCMINRATNFIYSGLVHFCGLKLFWSLLASYSIIEINIHRGISMSSCSVSQLCILFEVVRLK